jgi:PAS domain S-box-containing protein
MPKRRRTADDSSRVLEELRVRQTELETQNDELRSARNRLEADLRRYAELFDFAPVGYVVLDRLGIIREANLAFAHMVGYARPQLSGLPLTVFVNPQQRRVLRTFLDKQFEDGPGRRSTSLEIALKTKTAGAPAVRLVASTYAGVQATVLVAVHAR